MKNCKIRIRYTLGLVKEYESSTNYKRVLKLKKPKSKSSIRDISFPKFYAKILEKYFKEQEEKWRKNGLSFNDDSLIFTTVSCKPIYGRNFSRAWERFLKRINIDYKKLHSIRDTFATTLIRRGAKIHNVKRMLGHSSIVITEKYYIFVFPEDLEDTAALLDDFTPVKKLSREKVGNW